MTQPRTTITSLVRGKPIEIPIDQVVYFKTDCKYVAAHHPGGELLLSEPLKALEKEFAGRFLRIHRSTLVPFGRLVEMKRDSDRRRGSYYLRLAGVAQPLPVSRRYVPAVRKAIAEQRAAA